MTRTLRIAPEAEAELTAAALWYEDKCPGLGADLMAAIDAALERIAVTPLASAPWRRGLPFRRHVVRRFPFLVCYTVTDDAIQVHAFAHAKRRPGYWQDR